MELQNPLYMNQGMHVLIALFTVEEGRTKVLLIRRKNEPYYDKWALPGGAVYNNETLKDATKREVFEKTGIKDFEFHFSKVFDQLDRSPLLRMFATSYIGVIAAKKVSLLKETLKTSDADWFLLDNLPKEMAYDHKKVLDSCIDSWRESIMKSSILKALFPHGFTLPELQETYQNILGKTYDRRNFRKKILSENLLIDSGENRIYKGKKPAKLYYFK